ncbi:MAG: zinc-binding dehydrogenase [Gemmatimonadota bacterium]
MRALTISAHGGLDQLHFRSDLAAPSLASADDVRISVRAAALNHLDLFMVGGLPHITIKPPLIVGSDAAGVLVEVGADVKSVRPGDHVVLNPGLSCGRCEYCTSDDNPLCLSYGILGEHRDGTLAEEIVVPARNVARIAHDVAFATAAALPLASLTAWRMVMTKARVQPGENVLIQGIGGGVAQAALQLCRWRGARVWVTSSSQDKLNKALELGADEVINHRNTDVAREIRARTGKRGVDVVLDNVGEATWKSSLGALGKRGRLVTCGGTSGPIVETDVRRLFWNQWTLMGSTMGSESEFAAMTDAFGRGALTPVIDNIFPLERGREAYERLASGEQFGKVVVAIQ